MFCKQLEWPETQGKGCQPFVHCILSQTSILALCPPLPKEGLSPKEGGRREGEKSWERLGRGKPTLHPQLDCFTLFCFTTEPGSISESRQIPKGRSHWILELKTIQEVHIHLNVFIWQMKKVKPRQPKLWKSHHSQGLGWVAKTSLWAQGLCSITTPSHPVSSGAPLLNFWDHTNPFDTESTNLL
jgi:hypothetical protein